MTQKLLDVKYPQNNTFGGIMSNVEEKDELEAWRKRERYEPRILARETKDNGYKVFLIVGDHEGTKDKKRSFESEVAFGTYFFAEECERYVKRGIDHHVKCNGYGPQKYEKMSLDELQEAFEKEFQTICNEYQWFLMLELQFLQKQ